MSNKDEGDIFPEGCVPVIKLRYSEGEVTIPIFRKSQIPVLSWSEGWVEAEWMQLIVVALNLLRSGCESVQLQGVEPLKKKSWTELHGFVAGAFRCMAGKKEVLEVGGSESSCIMQVRIIPKPPYPGSQ